MPFFILAFAVQIPWRRIPGGHEQDDVKQNLNYMLLHSRIHICESTVSSCTDAYVQCCNADDVLVYYATQARRGFTVPSQGKPWPWHIRVNSHFSHCQMGMVGVVRDKIAEARGIHSETRYKQDLLYVPKLVRSLALFRFSDILRSSQGFYPIRCCVFSFTDTSYTHYQ